MAIMKKAFDNHNRNSRNNLANYISFFDKFALKYFIDYFMIKKLFTYLIIIAQKQI